MMIISFAGCSSSGKTTLCKSLSIHLSCPLLNLDKYWMPGCDKPIVNGVPSREQPHQYNGSLMAIDAMKVNSLCVILEGFLIFNYSEIVNMSSHKFYIDIPYELAKERRLKRTQLGGNQVWDSGTVDETLIDQGWCAHGKEEWQTWGDHQKNIPGVVIINGTKGHKEMLDDVLNNLGGFW